MRKYGHMMCPKNGKRTQTKCRCTKCGQELTPATAYYYVDGNSFAITNSSKPYCRECYIQTFGRY